MELQGYFLILRARRAVVATVTVVSVLIALVYSLAVTPTYVASSSVFLSTSTGRTSGELARSFSYVQGLVRSYSQVATEPAVLAPVISSLGLNTTPAELAQSITAQAPLDTVIIEIKASSHSATLAAKIANAVAAQLSSTVNSLVPGVSENSRPVRVTTLTQASIPEYSTSPHKTLNVTLGLLIGLLLGTVLAISRDALDVRIRSPRDAIALTRAPVIGSVMAQIGRPKRWTRPALRRRIRRSARELDNQLRTNFQFLRGRQNLKNVVFTSALLDGATSLTVSNLANALGGAGLRVLIVDADIRRPTLATAHGISNDLGLTSILVDGVSVRSVVTGSMVSPIWVLPTGPALRDPSLMLNDDAAEALFAQLPELYDVVLIKAPPVLVIAEGLMLARISDGVVVVTDEPAMNRDVLAEEIRALKIAGADVLGVVMMQPS
jgi:succinoglycan biosynthesis transport protein ExoP